jgi:pimeloyl-ACP methyl ester carboxylesterase
MKSNTYILVHGGWHGAWTWKYVKPLLEAKGHKVITFDLPSHGADKTPSADVTFADCVKKTVDIANAQTGEVILLGHSMAGTIIAQAAETLGTQKVSKLIFLDAFMPKRSGESTLTLADTISKSSTPKNPPFESGFIVGDMGKTISLNPDIAKIALYHDCSKTDVDFALANLSKQSIAVLATPVQITSTIYGVIPKYYILCTQSKDLDKTLMTTYTPIQQLFKLESSHSPFFSMPDKLVEILAGL